MKKYSYLFISLMTIALTMSACGKKNSDFAARYAKNKMGAQVADGHRTQAAGELAAAQGLEADVVNIQRFWTPEGQPGARFVTSTILINNQEMPVTTTHGGTEVVEGKVDVNGYTVVFHSMCANVSCNPYYASLEVYQNNKMIIQEGVRKYFEKTNTDEIDLYQWFQPAEALPFIGADSLDAKGMVGYLNQAGNVVPTGIIK